MSSFLEILFKFSLFVVTSVHFYTFSFRKSKSRRSQTLVPKLSFPAARSETWPFISSTNTESWLCDSPGTVFIFKDVVLDILGKILAKPVRKVCVNKHRLTLLCHTELQSQTFDPSLSEKMREDIADSILTYFLANGMSVVSVKPSAQLLCPR